YITLCIPLMAIKAALVSLNIDSWSTCEVDSVSRKSFWQEVRKNKSPIFTIINIFLITYSIKMLTIFPWKLLRMEDKHRYCLCILHSSFSLGTSLFSLLATSHYLPRSKSSHQIF